ncbi:MAG: P-loop NTPase [Myxococcales bacterium]|nr:P-loop NTPase [Myxococcales bacterium]
MSDSPDEIDGTARAKRSVAGGSARVVSVGGGKGGVGKSFFVANIATCLARAGHRVIAVDSDLEGANLHTCLGVPAPAESLADFVAQRVDDLGKLIVDTPISGLRMIAGTHAHLSDAQPTHLRRVRLMRAMRRLEADFVVIDLGAGVHSAVLDYFLVADEGLVVLSPEPTSVENAYSFLRAAFYRRMQLAMVGHGVRKLVTIAMDQHNERGLRTPLDLLREIEAIDSSDGARFVQTMREFRPRIVVNNVRTAEDIKLGFAVSSVCRKYFGIDAEYLGYVNQDDDVRLSVANRTPLVEYRPKSDASIYLERIARKLSMTGGPAAATTRVDAVPAPETFLGSLSGTVFGTLPGTTPK